MGARVLDQLLASLNRFSSLGTKSLAMPVLLILNARETTSCQTGSGSDQLIIKSWHDMISEHILGIEFSHAYIH